MQDYLDRLTKRHIAKLLSSLDEIQTPDIIKAEVKRHFYFFAKDVKEQVMNPDYVSMVIANETKGGNNGEKIY